MLSNLDERKISSKRKIKVRTFPGAMCKDMYHYLVPILNKSRDHIILHVGTNDVANHNAQEIVDKLLAITSFIKTQLPECNIVLSMPILLPITRKLIPSTSK